MSQRTVTRTFAIPHEPRFKPKPCKRAYAFSPHATAFQDGFRIAHAQKNKINLCFVDTSVQFDRLEYKLNKRKTKTYNQHQPITSATRPTLPLIISANHTK